MKLVSGILWVPAGQEVLLSVLCHNAAGLQGCFLFDENSFYSYVANETAQLKRYSKTRSFSGTMKWGRHGGQQVLCHLGSLHPLSSVLVTPLPIQLSADASWEATDMAQRFGPLSPT